MKGHQDSDLPRAAPASEGGVAASRRPARLLAPLGVAALVVLAAFLAGFGLFSTHVSNLATPADPASADAIIVLTGGQARLDAAIDLLKSGKGKRLLISGVHPDANRDDLSAVTGGGKQLFSCCVDIDHAALDTIGNAEESAKWVRSHAYDRIILVTNNYHMPRSLLEMGRLLGDAALEPYPVVNTRLDEGRWLRQPALRVLFTEYNKYLLALARGIVPLRPTANGLSIVSATAAQN